MTKCAVCQTEKTDGKDRRKRNVYALWNNVSWNDSSWRCKNSRWSEVHCCTEWSRSYCHQLCYHRACYRAYTNTKQIEVIRKNQEGKLESHYDSAFQALRSEVEPKLFGCLEVLRMSDLRQRYAELLLLQGIQTPLSHSEKLKVRMQKAFPGIINFWYPKHRSEAEIVYCEEVSKGQIIECGLNRSMCIPVP